ncbi:hypothetical protein AVEN_179231-1 [Araneus ventricosus]|uniref:Uncharacterized protein n=1 Tax=Araneus ventricosus TaxID=182803 RepID=A0A4Y2C7M7_ARAVE|nr:hypothetical protein AVEN_179231-1 [Araneus ventricosus]
MWCQADGSPRHSRRASSGSKENWPVDAVTSRRDVRKRTTLAQQTILTTSKEAGVVHFISVLFWETLTFRVTLPPASWSRESIPFSTGHGPFPSYPYRFRLHHSDICACGEKGDPLHYATSCHMTLSYHFTKPSAENTQLWWKSLLSNKLSRINIAKLISFLTENENLIKQPPDATSSSDSDPDFSLSPRPQTYGLRPSRGSIPRTQISPPISM